MMDEWILIIHVVSGFYNSSAMATVGTFVSEERCITAGEQAKAIIGTGVSFAKFACVKK